MPPVSKIQLLSDDLLQQLDERLRLSSFGDIELHSDWLKSLGHDVSKAAVSRYSLANRQRIRASGPSWTSTKNMISAALATQRLTCLQIAVSMNPSVPLAQSID